MNNSTEILFTIGQIIGGISTLIVFVAAIILFIKKRTLATWLIFIGNLLVVLTYIASLFITVFSGGGSVDTLLLAQSISLIIQNLSYLIFAVGFVILAISEFSKNKS